MALARHAAATESVSVYRVGLTGNVASGKSSVARVWQSLGANLIDADVLAREAVAPGTPGLRRVVDLFGPGVLDASGALDRDRLRDRVFRDAALRRSLERMLHPGIERLRQNAEAALEAAGESVVVHVIPLLFEAGLESGMDLIVFVDASEATRLERLVRDRGIERGEAERIIAAQMPADRKRRTAGIVLENEGTLDQLGAGAEAAWREIERRARAH
ncbi:MAG: dephospho-CoA kinase [Gemmatimonadetes bacterium]|nr:dephospho-CoA kinase [Gemmatimonadota bacterium]